MEVFEYLRNDGDTIADRLNMTVENYSEWPRDRVFEETKRELAAIQSFFKKEALLFNNLKNTDGLQPVLDQTSKERDSIKSQIDNLVMIHVDEPGFEQGLETIAKNFNEHMSFCKKDYYPSLKQKLSQNDLQHVNDQLEQMVMS